MKYDIIINKLPSTGHTKLFVARLMAADPAVSINSALKKLETVPLVFRSMLPKYKIKELVDHLAEVGVTFSIRESKYIDTTHKNINKNCIDSTEKDLPLKQSQNFVDILKPESVQKEMQNHAIKKVEIKSHLVSKESTDHIISKKQNNKITSIRPYMIVVTAIVVVIFVLLILSSRKPEYHIKHSKSLSTSSKTKSKPKLYFSKKHNKNGRNAITHQQKIVANAYVDSASTLSNEIERAIRFYKIAISYNEFNYNAWNGLLLIYQQVGMVKEAQRTRVRMVELFGESTFSIQQIIEQYGTLIDNFSDNTGRCRVEYHTSNKNKQLLVRESFDIIRFILGQSKCLSVTLFAVTGEGSGLLVSINKSQFPHSFADYKNRAIITWAE